MTSKDQVIAALRKVFAPVGVVFKGSGFYITDYRSDKYKEAAKKDSAAASKPPSSESKPAPKKESKSGGA